MTVLCPWLGLEVVLLKGQFSAERQEWKWSNEAFVPERRSDFQRRRIFAENPRSTYCCSFVGSIFGERQLQRPGWLLGPTCSMANHSAFGADMCILSKAPLHVPGSPKGLPRAPVVGMCPLGGGGTGPIRSTSALWRT
jgi:hypothetical protein